VRYCVISGRMLHFPLIVYGINFALIVTEIDGGAFS
jgi:hypothetical protein